MTIYDLRFLSIKSWTRARLYILSEPPKVGGDFKTIAFESQCITATNYEKVFSDNIERFAKREKAETPCKWRIYGFCKQKSHLVKRWLLCINECWLFWSEWQGSNLRPQHPKCRALPTAPHPDLCNYDIIPQFRLFVNQNKSLIYTHNHFPKTDTQPSWAIY